MEERYDSIREMVETDFVNCRDTPEYCFKYYRRWKEPHYDDEYYVFSKDEIDELPAEVLPEWYFTTEKENWTSEQQKEYNHCIFAAEEEYSGIWNMLVEEYYLDKEHERNNRLEEWMKNNPEKANELRSDYEDDRGIYRGIEDWYDWLTERVLPEEQEE